MDDYHPHYPSVDKDYFERLCRYASVLRAAKALGIRYLSFNLDHRLAVEAVIGPPRNLKLVQV